MPTATDPDPHATDPSPPDPAAAPRASLRQVLGAVFWSFFGIRKGKAMAKDEVSIRPEQAIIVGIFCAALFVATLLIVVRIVLRMA